MPVVYKFLKLISRVGIKLKKRLVTRYRYLTHDPRSISISANLYNFVSGHPQQLYLIAKNRHLAIQPIITNFN